MEKEKGGETVVEGTEQIKSEKKSVGVGEGIEKRRVGVVVRGAVGGQRVVQPQGLLARRQGRDGGGHQPTLVPATTSTRGRTWMKVATSASGTVANDR